MEELPQHKQNVLIYSGVGLSLIYFHDSIKKMTGCTNIIVIQKGRKTLLIINTASEKKIQISNSEWNSENILL